MGLHTRRQTGTASLAAFRTLGGIDVDPAACRDFEQLVGMRATCLDLFEEDDLRTFYGKEPPPAWREATPMDIQDATGNRHPEVIFDE